MIDRLGRNIEYVRISVTDKCNLRCIYCESSCDKHLKILSAPEIIEIVRVMARLDIKKARLTGGEPLLRDDLEEMIAGISAIPGIIDVPVTTNGTGFIKRLDSLKAAGLKRLNVSLDSLKPERFLEITKQNSFDNVMAGVEKALASGIKIKLNAVLIRGVNDDEIDDFIELAKRCDIEVRFIELMPIGKFGSVNKDKVITGGEILSTRPYLTPIGYSSGGVAKLYEIKGARGRVGLINALSHEFCHECNRVRLLSDGKLKLCLGDNAEIDLMPTLRERPNELLDTIRNAIYYKPVKHTFKADFDSNRGMMEIGG